MEQDLILKERADKCQIFNYHIEQIPVTDSFHLYLVDCRGERSLRADMLRIDALMKNKHLKKRDIVTFPAVYAETLEEIGRDNFENIDPIIDFSYRYNFITGMRREPSSFSSLDHYLGWVGIIASPTLKNYKITPRLFEYYFNNCRQFMEAYTPKDDQKFVAKVNEIAVEGRNIEQKREIEQLFGMLAIINPEMHRKYLMLYDELMKGFALVSHEVRDLGEYAQIIKEENGLHDK